MATKIEWTTYVYNPVVGCTKISEACQNCYAETMARRLQGNHIEAYKNGFKVSLNRKELDKPMRFKKPRMFFTCSMGDLFHEKVPCSYIDEVVDVIRSCPQHTFQILTKRADRMAKYFDVEDCPANVWLGVTCENSKHYDRIEWLQWLKCDNVKFLSCEPLLGDMADIDLTHIDWVITGGESGVNARRTPVQWFRNIRDACRRWNTPFFFKQWGAWGEDGIKRSKYKNGSLLDGEDFKMMPGDSW